VIGKSLGKYRIVDQLGAGGMGEVYRAEDSELQRHVALKVLPVELSADPQALARFKREARALASLDHPNIVSIHSVEEADGIRFLTMQLVTGEPLSQVISRGGLSVEQILDIAIPLTDALAAAHERGIIHRDLKPANIMVTDEGWVKVLDFGLAKSRQREQAPVATQMPTELMAETEQLTRQGMVLGTVPYMSPEQVQGNEITAQSDLYSLGAVMYELLTGYRPFRASSLSKLLHQIVFATPPPIHTLRRDISEELEDLVAKVMQKEPSERFADGRELAGALTQIFQTLKNKNDRIDHQEHFNMLRTLEFFHEFSHSEIWEILRASEWREYAADDEIIREGEMDDRFYIIVDGEVVVRSGRVRPERSARARASVKRATCAAPGGPRRLRPRPMSGCCASARRCSNRRRHPASCASTRSSCVP